MIPKVLIVDDDPALLGLLEEELKDYDEMFCVRTALGGQAALDLMDSDYFTLAITDLRMPGIDGFELLNRISTQYPDIPVIVITGYDRPKTREVVLKSGAADYLTKPLASAKLAARIIKAHKKMAEGGSLNNVTLETYLQLVEMEQQTCTLRISEKTGLMGVLFFRDGELMDARFGNMRGRDASYEILSWDGVSLSIENACIVSSKQITGELQAILLDAMRNRDESLDVENDLQRDDEDESGGAILLSDPVNDRAEPESAAAASSPPTALNKSVAAPSPSDQPELTPVDLVRKKLTDALGNKGAIEDVYSDSQWNELISQVEAVGEIFDAGTLNVVCLNLGRTGQLLIVPGDEPVIAALDADVSRDRAIGALM